MKKTPTKTRDRILQVSLAMFNRQGERNVSTNHIAAELGISPGNLYYHFNNKQAIVYQLFLDYARLVRESLQLPEGRELTWVDKAGYFEAILKSMWEYRFFHRDLSYLLQENHELQEAWVAFARQVMAQGRAVYRHFVQAGLIEATEEQIDALLLNVWVISTSWASFIHNAQYESGDEQQDKPLIEAGAYQLICLEEPYVKGEAARLLPALKQKYQPARPGNLIDRLLQP